MREITGSLAASLDRWLTEPPDDPYTVEEGGESPCCNEALEYAKDTDFLQCVHCGKLWEPMDLAEAKYLDGEAYGPGWDS